jgi:hypothetical protein
MTLKVTGFSPRWNRNASEPNRNEHKKHRLYSKPNRLYSEPNKRKLG